MPRFAEPVLPAKTNAGSRGAAEARMRGPALPQRDAKWHILQLRAAREASAVSPIPPSRQGLPERLKAGIENLSGVPMNDDAGLEREADLMGARAAAEARSGRTVDGIVPARGLAPGSAPLQRRAPTTNDVPDTTKSGNATIFDDVKVGYGPIFEKTVAVADHDPMTVIAAYQKAITPIGKALAAVRYTDVGITKFPNGVGAMPLLAPPNGVLDYLMTVAVGVGTVQSWLDVPSEGAMSKLFEDDLGWTSVKTKLGDWFVGRELLVDNQYIGLVDPLMVRMTFQSEEQGQQDWEVDTQFAESGKGYIVRIHDGKNNITGTIVTGPDFAAAANPPPPVVAPAVVAPAVAAPVVAAPVVAAPVVAAPVVAGPAVAAPPVAVPAVVPPPPTPARHADDYIYSSTHVGVAGGVVTPAGPGTVPLGTRVDALRGFQNGDTRVGQHDAFDAFTLMAAEGARFRPVAELGASAHLNATFFTKPKSAWKDAHGVTLHWLYQNWGLRFGSGYDITKETMATVVDAHGPPVRKKPNKPSYNLTTGVMDRN